jgi:hypothetical protein
VAGERRLYLDLDGVLADFDRGVREATGRWPHELPVGWMWAALARHPDFFGTLEAMHDAEALWAFCAPHRPAILTGLPMGSWAPAQKRRWVARVLGGHVEVIACRSRDKPRWSGPGRVIVDDREALREPWEAAGGAFVHHVSAERSVAELIRLGFADLRGAAADAAPVPPG